MPTFQAPRLQSLQRDYWILSEQCKRSCLKSGWIGPIYWLKVISWCRNVENAQDCTLGMMLPVRRKHWAEVMRRRITITCWGDHHTAIRGEVGLEERLWCRSLHTPLRWKYCIIDYITDHFLHLVRRKTRRWCWQSRRGRYCYTEQLNIITPDWRRSLTVFWLSVSTLARPGQGL